MLLAPREGIKVDKRDQKLQKQILNKLKYRETWRRRLAARLKTEEVRFNSYKLEMTLTELDQAKQMIDEQIRHHVELFGFPPPDDWKTW